MTNGLILLAFLAALVGFGWLRLRRRLGMNVTGRVFITVAVGFFVVVLAMWAATQH